MLQCRDWASSGPAYKRGSSSKAGYEIQARQRKPVGLPAALHCAERPRRGAFLNHNSGAHARCHLSLALNVQPKAHSKKPGHPDGLGCPGESFSHNMKYKFRPQWDGPHVKSDYPQMHPNGDICNICKPHDGAIVHEEGPPCCKVWDDIYGFLGTQHLQVIGHYPWLFWYCPVCGAKSEHPIQTKYKTQQQ
jgi:hypothetical protein